MNASRWDRTEIGRQIPRGRSETQSAREDCRISEYIPGGPEMHRSEVLAPTPTTLARRPSFPMPGLILLGPGNSLIACNTEAVQILAYPNPTINLRKVPSLIIEKTHCDNEHFDAPDHGHHVREIMSGRRRYLCSDYLLDMHGPQALRTRAILLDRAGNADITMQELCNRFRLTRRERQAVGYLVKGMTSKEIAQQMGVSPNTVKSFVRLVMTKAGVSTRAGLIGKVAGISLQPSSIAQGR